MVEAVAMAAQVAVSLTRVHLGSAALILVVDAVFIPQNEAIIDVLHCVCFLADGVYEQCRVLFTLVHDVFCLIH